MLIYGTLIGSYLPYLPFVKDRFGIGESAFSMGFLLGAIGALASLPLAPWVIKKVGTRKAARGKGLGKAMLAPVLAAADREGLPVYLENSNPANDGFYRSLGFERRGEFRVDETAPVVTTMWREPH